MEKGDVSEIYEFETILGEGAFSNVVLATHNETKRQFAIKIIEKEKIQSEVQRERIDREIRILKTCNHPNVVKLVETFESDLEISLVMELMKGGDLFDRITSKGTFTEDEARTAMYNILSAVDYLHDRSIVHRDLKPENLLYNSKEDSATLKIADFGLSKYSSETEGLITPCGTMAYTAPEVTNSKVYRKIVDIWSCGCILYFMLFGRPPFYSDNEEEIYDMVSDGSFCFPEHIPVSDPAKELIGCLLERDPYKRYTAKQALLHPWVTGRRQRDVFATPTKTPTKAITTTTPITTSSPLTIPSLRVSFNSAIEAQRGPLTPPLSSPLESSVWKKRAAKSKNSPTSLSLSSTDVPKLNTQLFLAPDFSDGDFSSEKDSQNNDEDMTDMDKALEFLDEDVAPLKIVDDVVKRDRDDVDEDDMEMEMMMLPSEEDSELADGVI